jgi:hypothetical protein
MMAADRIPCGFQENPTKLLADFVPTVIAEPRELFLEKSRETRSPSDNAGESQSQAHYRVCGHGA